MKRSLGKYLGDKWNKWKIAILAKAHSQNRKKLNPSSHSLHRKRAKKTRIKLFCKTKRNIFFCKKTRFLPTITHGPETGCHLSRLRIGFPKVLLRSGPSIIHSGSGSGSFAPHGFNWFPFFSFFLGGCGGE